MATFPERALALVNHALSHTIEAGLRPLSGFPPIVSLFIVSLITAILIVSVVACVSDQTGLSRAKRGIHAALFEIRLFNDDLPAVMSALRDALRHNAHYLLLSLVPLAWLAVPLVLMATHLQAYYGYAGLTQGEPALVTVKLRHGLPQRDTVSLDAPVGVRVDTGVVRLAGTNEVLWRIVPTNIGEYVLTVRVGASSATKSLQVSPLLSRRSPRRVSPGVLDQLLHPSDPPLAADSPIDAIALTYPERDFDIVGWHVHWTVIYLVLSAAGAFALARFFGIVL